MTDTAVQETSAPPKRIPFTEFTVSGVLIVLAVYIIIDTLGLSSDFSDTDPVGPRTFPFITAGGLLLVAVLLIVDVLRGGRGEAEGGEDVDLSEPSDWLTVAKLAGVFILNIALIDVLGWAISGAILFFGSAWALGSKHYVRDLIVSVALSVGTFYAFYVGLGVPLPAGILDGIL